MIDRRETLPPARAARELSCIFCGRPAKSASERAEPERDAGHRPEVIAEPDAQDHFAHRRVMHGACIAFAGIRGGRVRFGGGARRRVSPAR
jgi:hypothetical protein